MIKDKTRIIKNVYYMLSYAFELLKEGTYQNVNKEEFENIHNLFALILEKGISQQLKRGLYKEYVYKVEDLSTLRGKINLNNTIKNIVSNRKLLNCEYDDLQENNVFNRILKTTVCLLIKQNELTSKNRKALKNLMLYFSNVDVLEPSIISWTTLRFQRNNANYRMLISICQLIIEGMLLTTEEGKYHLKSFLDKDSLYRLFQKFVLEYFRKQYPELGAKGALIDWAVDDGVTTMLPDMITDITLTYGSNTLIIDTKYYEHTLQNHFGVQSIHSNNIYQIFAYVKNKEYALKGKPHKVSGMLLYAKTDEEKQPDAQYLLSGNKISVKTLDLNCEFDKLKEQLDQIATAFKEEIF